MVIFLAEAEPGQRPFAGKFMQVIDIQKIYGNAEAGGLDK